MIRVNYIGTAGGLGVTTLTILSAMARDGMAVERHNHGDMAALLGVAGTPDDVFRHRFGDERIVFADCGRTVPAPPGTWCNVLVVPRRYLGVRQVGSIMAGGTPIHGWVDVTTEVDVITLADVKATMGDLTHLGSMMHSPTAARVIDAGLINTRVPKHMAAETARITDNIINLLEDA